MTMTFGRTTERKSVSPELNPTKPVFAKDSRAERWTHRAGIASVVFFVLTLLLVFIAVAKGPSWGLVVTGLAFTWAVSAPAWFWYEYFFLYRKDGLPGSLELYKQGQQVSVAIWAALALSLGALASNDHFMKAESKSVSAAAKPGDCCARACQLNQVMREPSWL